MHGYARDEAGLLEIADDRLAARRLLPNTQQVLAPDGYWTGQSIVTSGGVYGGFSSHPSPLLIGLTVIDRTIRVEFEREIGSRDSSLAPDLISSAGPPRYLGNATSLIGLWFTDVNDNRYIACDPTTLKCTSGHRYAFDAKHPAAFTSNPSRP